VGRNATEGRTNQVVNPARKFIRLQEIGMSCWLSWPVAMMLADMYGVFPLMVVLSPLLLITGVVIFAIGHYGRQDLRAREDNQ
jgi:hypothetical protein